MMHNPEHHIPSTKITILIVDDDISIRKLCQQALKNYRGIQASTCEEALRLFEREQVDLVLSDIMMPGGSGLDLLGQIKAIDPNTPVVMMTAFSDRDIILKALKENADDFINKPLNLLQLRTTVEKALGRKALKEELARIKRSEELKNDFLSLVSHKLRTPITGISLFLQNLQSGMFAPDEQMYKKSLLLANKEAIYLGNLFSDLLAFSQAMAHGSDLDRRPCDLNEIMAGVLLKCREAHCCSDIVFDIAAGTLPHFMLDAPKIRFALLQVLDNALKFSGEKGRVSLKLEMDPDSVLITVSDNGPGIPESEIPKVFEKFYQIDPDHTGQIRGFGLGLFYARDYVRQHGGGITIDSRPGSGTTVTISLPLREMRDEG